MNCMCFRIFFVNCKLTSLFEFLTSPRSPSSFSFSPKDLFISKISLLSQRSQSFKYSFCLDDAFICPKSSVCLVLDYYLAQLCLCALKNKCSVAADTAFMETLIRWQIIFIHFAGEQLLSPDNLW